MFFCSGHPDTKACPLTPSRLFPVSPVRGGVWTMDVQTRHDISRMVEDRGQVKLLLSANRKSYMPRRLAQQRMTLSDLEWHHPHRTLSLRMVD